MGLNEAAGYVAVALAALGAGALAATHALRPQPFVLDLLFAVAGLLLSLFFVRESRGHATLEAQQHQRGTTAAEQPSFAQILLTS
jgi:Zn-dependent protease with chaperone function